MLDTHETLITADGSTLFPCAEGRRYAVTVAGDFGGGTVTVNHLNNGTKIPYTLGEFTADGGCWIITTGKQFDVTLTGATSPSISIRITPVNPGS